ncbi:MAG: DUF4367 domain-containing protein [Patescibacteria group bacterium]|nr:DUF4367 domain-containing protein [Patescibacteria group bacterium]
MNCPKCGKETKGVRLNGNIYCNFCGELIKKGQAKEKGVKDKTEKVPDTFNSTPVAKIIGKDGEEKTEEVGLLEAEEKVLEVIENENTAQGKRPIIMGKANIIKSGRKRADHHDLSVIMGEPDPIEEPELPSPKELEIESKSADEPDYPLLDAQHREELSEKNKARQSFLNAYLKESTKEISGNNTEKKRKKHKERKSHKVFWISFVVLLLLALSFTGLVIYVNYFAVNPENIETDLLDDATFSYTKPTYITPGYELSYLSKVEEDKVEYVYESQLEEGEIIIIRVIDVRTKDVDIYEDYIEGTGADYSSILVGGLVAWTAGDNTVYLKKDGIVYEVLSDVIGKSEIIKIAEGIALGD